MDPQSVAFTPRNDPWGLQSEMSRIAQIQQEHADRLLRLERRQEDDARMKSVWGTSSPFPGVLSGTPQHGPINQSQTQAFNTFDEDQQTNLIGSLHLDGDEEPRRFGPASRANSVRFDETANPGHWAHAPRPSGDFLPRTPSVLSGLGHPMIERTSSHKSLHSSSSRLNSLVLDSSYSTAQSSNSPIERPGRAPGLFILGAAPAIIRCWLNTNFKHDALLYAAVCTGSYKSFLDVRLVDRLGFTQLITQSDEGTRIIKLPVYLPEAITQPASSRSNSPAPQLPSLTIKFNVVDGAEEEVPKAIQIFLGSDMLRAHNADVLFSSNTLTMFDDDHNKLSMPLVRPEDEATFKNLYVTSGQSRSVMAGADAEQSGNSESLQKSSGLSNGMGSSDAERSPSIQSASEASTEVKKPITEKADSLVDAYQPDNGIPEEAPKRAMSFVESSKHLRKPSVSSLNTKVDSKELQESSPATATPTRVGSSPAIWGNWRRDQNQNSGNATDWANVGKGTMGATYQRPGRDQGIKVLKPLRTPSRITSQPGVLSPGPGSGQSRFFDEGRRRNSTLGSDTPETPLKRSMSAEKPANAPNGKESQPTSATKARSANPVGSASAFAWMNSTQSR